jgi:hypothetical protein
MPDTDDSENNNYALGRICVRLRVKSLLLSDFFFYQNWYELTQFSQIFQYQIFMKILSQFNAHRRTDAAFLPRVPQGCQHA